MASNFHAVISAVQTFKLRAEVSAACDQEKGEISLSLSLGADADEVALIYS
jgi:hypothetical protein